MLNTLKRLITDWQKKSLTRPELAYLFDAPPDEGWQEWVALDCEMSGLNPKKHHFLSIGVVRIKGNVIDTGGGLYLICRPPKMPEADTIVIHGLRPHDVANGLSYEAMLSQVLPFIGNRPIVGFCPQLDLAFLNPLVKAYMGTPLPNPVIDVRKLYQHHTGNRTEGVSHQGLHLNTMLETLEIPNLGSHNAFNDAVMTAMVFLHLR